jgi:hypothetical protein
MIHFEEIDEVVVAKRENSMGVVYPTVSLRVNDTDDIVLFAKDIKGLSRLWKTMQKLEREWEAMVVGQELVSTDREA